MVPTSLMFVIAFASAAASVGITRAHMRRRRPRNVFFIDGNGNVHMLADRRRQPSQRARRAA